AATTAPSNDAVPPTCSPNCDVRHEWTLGGVKGASDGEETPKPTTDGSESQDSSADTATETSDDEPAVSSDEAAEDQTEDEEDASASETPGEPNAEGKCYPKGYEAGDDFPG